MEQKEKVHLSSNLTDRDKAVNALDSYHKSAVIDADDCAWNCCIVVIQLLEALPGKFLLQECMVQCFLDVKKINQKAILVVRTMHDGKSASETKTIQCKGKILGNEPSPYVKNAHDTPGEKSNEQCFTRVSCNKANKPLLTSKCFTQQ